MPLKIVTAMDSFKGTMSSIEACERVKNGIQDVIPDAEVVCIPVADGGEGTVEAFHYVLGGELIRTTVTGPLFEPVEAEYLILPDGRTAVIEMAAASGLPLVGERKNPLKTTTKGTGELLRHAAERGCTHILLGLGGSATNDGGAGALAALGIKLLDAAGAEIEPTGGGLSALSRIDSSEMAPCMKECRLTLLCDVDNPLCGENGASAVYGPQKGADEAQVALLDRNLRRLAACIRQTTGREVETLPGGGAAGGIAAGLAGFFEVELRPGIQLLLETTGFQKLAAGADLVITGEGRIDFQSVRGKVPYGIGMAARTAGVPAIVIAGDMGSGYDAIYDCGIEAVFSINHLAKPYREVRERSPEDLQDTVRNLARFWRLGR